MTHFTNCNFARLLIAKEIILLIDHYTTWAELFQIDGLTYEALDNIIPPSDANEKAVVEAKKQADMALWKRVDAIILSWIYGTISTDLLNTIIEPRSTTTEAWNRLRDIFSDIKNSRALYLQQEFSKIQMEDFPNVSSYYQSLKSIADQLANIGSPVPNDRLILKVISGHTEAYANV
ncbi:hypothetical protein LIER_23071 [Lithospermum erythrorhizon]|uniref:Uncharacterized protein n=1 Tax=Lithospermum erythrorhizon TaxID=34254 RepID=A0AAV3QYE3_LITER